MSKCCQITGKKLMFGNNVSHSNRKTRRRFLPNLHWHRFWCPNKNSYIRLLLSNKGLRIINKKGIEFFLKKIIKKN